MVSAKTRLERLEVQVCVTGDQREYERRKRFCFNIYRVSDAALMASLMGTLEGTELPDWARREFEAPIPADAESDRVTRAEAAAQEMMRADSFSDVDTDYIVRKAEAALRDVSKMGFSSPAEYIHCFHAADIEGKPWSQIRDERQAGGRDIATATP